MSKLTVKQEKFAQKYVKCGCASEAYRHAYNTSRMKDKSIHELSCRLLADVKVSSRVDQLKVKASKRHEISFDKMLEMFRVELFKSGRRDKPVPSLADE